MHQRVPFRSLLLLFLPLLLLAPGSGRAQSNAEVAEACITVGNLNFGTFTLGKDGPRTLPMLICNEGADSIRFVNAPGTDSVLQWIGKNFSVPRSTLDSLRNKVVLGPAGRSGSCFTIYVTFTPTTPGLFVSTGRFFSNATCGRDSSIWRATVISNNPALTSYNWNARWLVANPCPEPNSKNPERQYEAVISAFNSGNTSFQVKEIKLIGPDADAGIFALDSNKPEFEIRVGDIVDPITAAPADTPRVYQQVLFKPNSERMFHCEVMLVTMNDDTVRSTLDGTGIESHVKVTGFDADTSIFTPELSVDGTIEVSSTGTRPLTVYNVIASDPTDFVIDLPVGGYPIVLAPGEKKTLSVHFRPAGPGEVDAKVLVVGDHSYCDGLDSTNVLTGYSAALSAVPQSGEEAISMVSVGPTPAHDRAEITLRSARTAHLAITLVDRRGVEVVREHRTVEAGSTSISLPVGTLESGVYYCRIEGEGMAHTAPLVIVR